MGLAEVLGAHEPATAQGGVYCEGCDWERNYDGTGSPDSWGAHVEAALLAHLADVLGSDETRQVIAEVIVANEPYWGAIDDMSVARDVLAAVREVLGLPGGGA